MKPYQYISHFLFLSLKNISLVEANDKQCKITFVDGDVTELNISEAIALQKITSTWKSFIQISDSKIINLQHLKKCTINPFPNQSSISILGAGNHLVDTAIISKHFIQ